MPRTARAAAGNWCYHVLNRGRAEVFHKDDDYTAFLALLAPARERLPMRILGWCLWTHLDGNKGMGVIVTSGL